MKYNYYDVLHSRGQAISFTFLTMFLTFHFLVIRHEIVFFSVQNE